VRYVLPQPWEELPHTADVGLAASGATPEEALARLVLGLGAMLAGGGGVGPAAAGRPAPGEAAAGGEARIDVAGGADLAQTAVTLLREVLFRFATGREIPVAVEVLSFAPGRATADVTFGRWDPERNAEGADVKAVTYHAARFEREGGGWRAQVILDT